MSNSDFQKVYLGSGVAVEQFPKMIELSIDLTEALKHAFEFKGKLYIKGTVSPLMKTSEYGKTHSFYIKERTQTIDESHPGGHSAQMEMAIISEPTKRARRKSVKS